VIAGDLAAALARAEQYLRQGAADRARDHLDELVSRDPEADNIAESHALRAQSCIALGDPAAGLAAIERAIALRPDWAQAHSIHALALRDLGMLDPAAEAIATALMLRPDDHRAWTSRGTIERRRGRLADAELAFRRATAQSPAHEPAWRGLAETLQSAGKDDASLEAWRRWLELRGGAPEARAQLGWALARMHRWDAAEVELSAAVGALSAGAVTATRLGFVRRERGDSKGAVEAFGRAADLSPGSLTPKIGRALFLPLVYDSAADLERWRSRYTRGLDALEAELPRLLEKPEALWQLDWANFYLAYQGHGDLPLQRRYASLIERMAAAAAPEWTAPKVRADTGRARARIGFASSFFRECTVGAYFGPWLTSIDRDRFEVEAFYFGSEIDETTNAIRSSVERFIHLPHDPRQIATAILSADLDVLVYPQLGMDGLDTTLAALRLAPVQCAAWGHPETTGSAAIDCFFSCAEMEPGDASAHYSERLLVLPGLGTRYAMPGIPQVSRAQLGLPDAVRLYACPHSLFKIHPDNDAVFADLLTRDRGGALVLCADRTQPVTKRFRERLARTLRQHGIDTDRRVIFQPLRPPPEFRAMLAACDVMLDTLHWSGGNTSLDALAAGLPIVACPGSLMRGRQSAAMLRALGLPELVAANPGEHVVKAIEVAGGAYPALHTRIAERRSALFDQAEPIRALEDHLLRLCGRDR
jgi:CRISPR-associated protein Csy1